MRKIALSARTLMLLLVAAGLVGAGARSLLAAAPRSVTPRTRDAARVDRSVDDLAAAARSTSGALDAATTYVRAGQQIFDLDPDERRSALRAMAADAAARGFVAQQRRQLAELDGIAARGEGPLTWDVAVLATRVDAHTRQRARVAIWRLGVLSIAGLTAPLAEYTTVTYELVWERGAWRIWSETQVPGPSPMPHPEATPSTPAEFDAALEGFVRYPAGPEPEAL